MRRKVPISEIQENPYWSQEHGYSESKIESLVSSIESLGFLGSLVGRQNNGTGSVEIAYGHHRVQALLRIYDQDFEIPIDIEDFSNEQMAEILCAENCDDWETTPYVHMLTVKSVIEAAGRGDVRLPPVAKNCPSCDMRTAPSFIPLGDDASESKITDRTFTIRSVIGWLHLTRKTATAILNALCAVEQGYVKADAYKHTSSFREMESITAKSLTSQTGASGSVEKLSLIAKVKALREDEVSLQEQIDIAQGKISEATEAMDDPDCETDAAERIEYYRERLDRLYEDRGDAQQERIRAKDKLDKLKESAFSLSADQMTAAEKWCADIDLILSNSDKKTSKFRSLVTPARNKKRKISKKEITTMTHALDRLANRCISMIADLEGAK